MKKSNRSSRRRAPKQKPIGTGGKRRSLYSPELGSSNWRKARDGRYGLDPAFRAYRMLQGVRIATQLMLLDLKTNNLKQIELRMGGTERQLSRALDILAKQATGLKSLSDKLRFAEAIAEAADRTKDPDDDVERVCWRAIEMRTRGGNPSQIELRRAVETLDRKIFPDLKWKRILKRTGLNRLPTHREKTQGISLRKY